MTKSEKLKAKGRGCLFGAVSIQGEKRGKGKGEEEANKRFRMGGREGVRASPARSRPEEDAI